MTSTEVLAALKAVADPKVFAMNKKNGAGDNQFGVKMGDIRKLAAKIKKDHALALELWATGNNDARFVAVLIMDVKKLSAKEIDTLVRSNTFVHVADWFNNYIVKEFPGKEELREKWMKEKQPYAARAGWSLTTGRIVRAPEGIDIKGLLDRIEKELPAADPVIQWNMNNALAQIGINHPEYRSRAVEIGERLGIYRDYPTSKGCTSPFAPIWINEMVKRQK
ncbi:MAG: DNA alkylation repair protein [Chitinophagaceae bacterium]|nr:MAG: DNA alkylation repair protein [Chitinophagaceae bacterium]